MSEPMPITGGGALNTNISPTIARRIQRVANRLGVTISLVGSRASGSSQALSDFDYVIRANHRIRHSARFLLPRGPMVDGRPGIEIFGGAVYSNKPHITFIPDLSKR